jgi:DNA-binding transcriptional ArsR family regulator
LSDLVGDVFAALSDPTRRDMVQTLLRDGWTSAPLLSARLPITRQAIAKHLAALEHAGLLERLPTGGREVRYTMRTGALAPAAEWLRDTEAGWDRRLRALKRTVEGERAGRGEPAA